MYAEMFTIYQGKLPWIEVRRNPYSKRSQKGLFEDGSCHLRLSNRFCYSVDPVGVLRQFILEHHYHYVGISRVDICLDFLKFDKGDDPEGFLKAYFKNQLAKINQCNISAHGRDLWSKQVWNSVKWGSPSSMVSTKMYNKTLEMSETGNKKGYIVDQWRQAQLAEYQIVSVEDPKAKTPIYKNVVVPYVPEDRKRELGINRNRALPLSEVHPCNVWRVEFTIRTEGRHWVDLQKGKQVTLDLTTIDSRDKLLFIFHSLASHYFHFKRLVNKPDGTPQRKDRCPDKQLFVISNREAAYRPKQLASQRDATRMDRAILRRMYEISMDYDNTTNDERRSAFIISKKLESDIMQTYAKLYAEDIERMQKECPF